MRPSSRDLYPAELFLPDGSAILKGRVKIEQTGRVRVWSVNGDRQPVLRLDTQLTIDSLDPKAHPVLTGQTPQGRLLVTAVGGCECGGAYVLRRIKGVDF